MSTEPESIELPDDLIDEMRRMDRSVAVLTPVVDRHVTDAAAAHFRHRRPRLPNRLRSRAMAGTLAASLVVGALVVRVQTGIEPGPLANDVDGSGVVDILDAFALARMNQDTTPSAQDRIDALVMDIVALNGFSL